MYHGTCWTSYRWSKAGLFSDALSTCCLCCQTASEEYTNPHNWGLWHENYDLFLWLITGMVCVCMKSVSGAVLRIQSFFFLDKIYLYTNVFVETCIFLFEGNYQNPIPQKASNSAFGSPSQSFPIHHYHIYICIYMYIDEIWSLSLQLMAMNLPLSRHLAKTRATPPSCRSVRIFIPSASSTWIWCWEDDGQSEISQSLQWPIPSGHLTLAVENGHLVRCTH
jgi:hypothetical protein